VKKSGERGRRRAEIEEHERNARTEAGYSQVEDEERGEVENE
jgi:hypothetical protein